MSILLIIILKKTEKYSLSSKSKNSEKSSFSLSISDKTVHFEDFDGQYYRITMSVGKNDKIDTIYNVGRLDKISKKNRSKSSVTAQRPLSQEMTNKEDLSSINSITSNKRNINTTCLADKGDRNIIASIKIDGKEQVNNIEINTNVQQVYMDEIIMTSLCKAI